MTGMALPEAELVRLAVALGVGLLIGAERERRQLSEGGSAPAGIRTFALVSLSGGTALLVGGVPLLVAGAVVFGGLAALSYTRSSAEDPGLTSEVALVVAYLLGALAARQPALAASLGVVVTVILASRTRLHRFVHSVLTEQELNDALLLGAAALVVLPLAPDRAVGPFAVLNPRTLWKLVVLVMAISAAGYVGQRLLGPRYGLPLSGLASGFVSSTATIGAMASRARSEPALLGACVAGAALSTIATVAQLGVVLLATSHAALRALAFPLLVAGAVSVLWGLFLTLRTLRTRGEVEASPGRAFNPLVAVGFAAAVSAILLISASANALLGSRGLVVASALAGFADAHSPSIAVAALVAAGKLPAGDAVLPILLAFTTNSVSKAVLAVTAGGPRFAVPVVAGVVLVTLAAFAGALVDPGALPALPSR